MFTDDVTTDITLFGGSQSRPITNRAVILYTDYDAVEIYYECHESQYYWFTVPKVEYYISVRDRSFDSYTKFKTALGYLLDLGIDLDNSMAFIQNGPDCKN
jgi:hypothetical protein